MPTEYIKKVAKKKHQPIEKSEEKWEHAKKQAAKQYGKVHSKEYWAEVMTIYKSMEGEE